jgi:hypothetical protein
MVEIDHALGILTQRLGPQLVNARSAAERDEALKTAMDSTQFDHLMDQEGDEVHDKVQSALQNSQIIDKVHISPEAQKLFEGSSGQAPPAPEGTPEETG